MKLTSDEALKLLDNSRGLAEDDNWITHCICVGNSAGKIAQKLNLDEDFAKTLGWIVNTFLNNFYKDTFLYSIGVK